MGAAAAAGGDVPCAAAPDAGYDADTAMGDGGHAADAAVTATMEGAAAGAAAAEDNVVATAGAVAAVADAAAARGETPEAGGRAVGADAAVDAGGKAGTAAVAANTEVAAAPAAAAGGPGRGVDAAVRADSNALGIATGEHPGAAAANPAVAAAAVAEAAGAAHGGLAMVAQPTPGEEEVRAAALDALRCADLSTYSVRKLVHDLEDRFKVSCAEGPLHLDRWQPVVPSSSCGCLIPCHCHDGLPCFTAAILQVMTWVNVRAPAPAACMSP